MTRSVVKSNRISDVTDGEMTEFKRNLGLHGFTADDVRAFNRDPALLGLWVAQARELFAEEWYRPFDSCPTHQWRNAGVLPVQFRLTHSLPVRLKGAIEIEVVGSDAHAKPIVHVLSTDEWTTVHEHVQMRQKSLELLNIEIRLKRPPRKN